MTNKLLIDTIFRDFLCKKKVTELYITLTTHSPKNFINYKYLTLKEFYQNIRNNHRKYYNITYTLTRIVSKQFEKVSNF